MALVIDCVESLRASNLAILKKFIEMWSVAELSFYWNVYVWCKKINLIQLFQTC